MTTPHCAAGCDDPACDRNPAPGQVPQREREKELRERDAIAGVGATQARNDRPACPACQGSGIAATLSEYEIGACAHCDDGTMRGIDDPTPEERRIAELEERLERAANRLCAIRECIVKASRARTQGRCREYLGAAIKAMDSGRTGGGR